MLALAAVAVAREAPAQLTGETGAHDPSSLIKDGSTYHYFATGRGIISRTSADQTQWSAGPSIFSTPPAWTTQAVPGFDGTFWAPDVIFRNNQYYLYYSVSSWGSKVSAIGLATSPTLNPSSPNYGWTDQGIVVQSGNSTNYNAIDPSVMEDSTGRVWMTYGSFWNGIYVTELDRNTGKRLTGAPLVNVAGPGPGPEIEAASLLRRGNFYYLFANWGQCCAGVDSTYNIRVGRSTSPTGPFLDRNGVNMLSGGGSLFLDDDGSRIGPGHFEIFSENGREQFGYHYYDGNRNGRATYALRDLHWTADAWPSQAAVNPNWLGGVSGSWAQAGNWSDGVPNGVGHVANFANASSNRVVGLDGSGRTVGTVNFAADASYTIANTGHVLTLDTGVPGDSATLNVSAGSHTIAAPISAADHLGVNVSSPFGALTLGNTVSGAAGLTKYGHGRLLLGGANTYAGSVFVKWGILDVTGSVSAGQFSSVGQSGETATLIVRGTGRFTTNADLNIGDTGDANTPATGTLGLRDDANVTVNSGGGFFVGSGFSANTRAVGTVNQTGGTLTANGSFDGAFVIGGRNSSLAAGTYNLTGGTVNANTNVRVGGRGTGTVNQTGGAFNATGYVAVGRFAGSTGDWTVSGGGTLDVSNPARLLIVGEEGNGTLTVRSTGRVSTAGALRIGHTAGGAGTVNLDAGGTITAPAVTRGGGAGTFNFNGGTLRPSGDNPAFMQGLTNANVKAGGARLDTQAYNVTVAQPLRHDPALGATRDGGLTKLGAGTLTLTAANTYTGGTHVQAGTLRLNRLHENNAVTITGGNLKVLDSTPTLPAHPAGNNASVSRPLSLTIANNGAPLGARTYNGQLDLGNNDLILDYSGVSPLADVEDMVRAGYHTGDWLGNGITSSTANANRNFAVAVADNARLTLPFSSGRLFSGQTVDTTTILVKFTHRIDLDLDGVISTNDATIFNSNYAEGAPAYWSIGDVDYDRVFTTNDATLFNSFYSEALASVPEPAAAGLVCVAAAVLVRRRGLTPSTR